jgi:hypothetical protein
VFNSTTGAYIAGSTRDLSRGGALLDLVGSRPACPGDDIEVFVAWGDRAVLTSADAVRASVRRVIASGEGRQTVGVEFAESLAQPAAAAAA